MSICRFTIEMQRLQAAVALCLQVNTPLIRYLGFPTPSKNCLSIATYVIPDSEPELNHDVRLCDRTWEGIFIDWPAVQLFSFWQTVWIDDLLIPLAALAPILGNVMNGFVVVIDLLWASFCLANSESYSKIFRWISLSTLSHYLHTLYAALSNVLQEAIISTRCHTLYCSWDTSHSQALFWLVYL